MRTGYVLFAIISILAAPSALAERRATPPPRNETGISCRDFRRNPDGSWSPIRRVTIVGPHGPFSVTPGQIFWIQLQGTTNYGVNIAEILDDQCL
ncbi:MAG: hypothetical protein WB816_17170 [Methylocystis sp.]